MSEQPYNDCGDTAALVRQVGAWTLGTADGEIDARLAGEP